MSPYYGPNEDAATIELERNFVRYDPPTCFSFFLNELQMAGDVVVGTGFGVQLVLYTSCALFLWKRRKHSRQPLLLLGYMTCMLLIETVFVAVQARTVQMIYIDNRNYPSGPWQFFLDTQTAAVNVIFYATLFLLTFLSDLLVLWRCWVIWGASGQHKIAWAVIVFPGILLLASFALGTLWTLESSQPTLSLYSALPMAYGTSYYALSLGANIILTLLPADLANHYISLATVIVESAALYSVFALLFLITYAIDHPTNQIWLAVASACQQIANLLIIYRLAEGSAWQKDTLTTKTAPIHFKSHDQGRISSNLASFHIAAPPPVSASDDSSSPEFKEGRSNIV
ncbi:hypothetical protein C8R43DRAFT_1091863 [Mycena crocata]|nr:hypothetical protein C8R43DRAFT_1091863 [Mycena crocata]